MAWLENDSPSRDPYVYPDTDGVLINKFGIKDAQKLAATEYSFTQVRKAELEENPIQGNFDLNHLQAIHKSIFQDVFAWAGELRTIPISKGGSTFGLPQHFESYAGTISDQLKGENHLKDLDSEKFSHRLSYYFGEINALHPFREGNGRATQTFFRQLSAEAGYHLDFSKVDRLEWNRAAHESHHGNLEPVKSIFKNALSPIENSKAIETKLAAERLIERVFERNVDNRIDIEQAKDASAAHSYQYKSLAQTKLDRVKTRIQENNRDKLKAENALQKYRANREQNERTR